jgi:hypothetical protein
MSACVGDRVTIICQASQVISYNLNWCQQKPRGSHMLLIYCADSLEPAVSSRLSGNESSPDYSLAISNMESEDVADCYC